MHLVHQCEILSTLMTVRRMHQCFCMPLVQLDDDALRRLLPDGTDLTAADVETIGRIALLTAEIDFDEDPEESSLLERLNQRLWEVIGAPAKPVAVVSPLPLDREERMRWIRELVPRLTSTYARRLAYATAYLVVVVDHEISPIESALLGELQRALGLDDERAERIAELAAEILTVAVEIDERERTMRPSA